MSAAKLGNAVEIELTIDEKLLIVRAAKLCGVTPHEWCRRALLEAAGEQTEDTELEDAHVEDSGHDES